MQTIYPSADVQAWAARIYGPNKRLLITDYVIPCYFPASIAAGSSASVQSQIQANADFVLCRIGYTDDDSIARDSVMVQLIDSATGEQFGNSEIPANIFCDIDRIHTFNPLPYPRWIGGNTAMSVFMRNDDQNDPIQDAIVTLHGFLIREY